MSPAPVVSHGLADGRWKPLEILFWLLPAAAYFLAPGYLVLVSQIMIVGLFAVSLDLILGYAGIVSLGHAAFFGLGAYTAGLLAVHGWGEPISGLFAAAAVAALAGRSGASRARGAVEGCGDASVACEWRQRWVGVRHASSGARWCRNRSSSG